MIIREATKEDIPRIIVLGKEFAVESQKAHEMSISDEKIKEFANTVVENKFWTVLVMEVDEKIVGMLIAFYSYIFFSDEVACQEVVWYVQKGFKDGLELMVKLEEVALLRRNVKRIVMGYKPDYVDMKNLYERKGYHLLECQYIKDIQCQYSRS